MVRTKMSGNYYGSLSGNGCGCHGSLADDAGGLATLLSIPVLAIGGIVLYFMMRK